MTALRGTAQLMMADINLEKCFKKPNLAKVS